MIAKNEEDSEEFWGLEDWDKKGDGNTAPTRENTNKKALGLNEEELIKKNVRFNEKVANC